MVDKSVGVPILNLPIVDRFGPATINLNWRKQVKRLCNPIIFGDERGAFSSDADHLVGYIITNRTPPFTQLLNQQVTNEFGTFTIRVVRPIVFLVPSNKSVQAPPPPLTSPTIDHFTCYRTRGGRFFRAHVPVLDQFGSWSYDLLRVDRLCVAANKNGEGFIDPNAALLCYKARTSKSTIAFHGLNPVFVDNQFGPDTLRVTHPRELCVPSTVSAAANTCGNGVRDLGEQCDPPGSICDNLQLCGGDCLCPGM